MEVIFDLLFFAAVLFLVVALSRGVLGILYGGFLMSAVSSLICGSFVMTIVSFACNLALSMSGGGGSLAGFLKGGNMEMVLAALGALSQPSLGAIALVGVLLTIAAGVSHISTLLEEMAMLLTSLNQRETLERMAAKRPQGGKK